MHEGTRLQLKEMTQEFYEFHARSFAGTRQRPWNSWDQILDIVKARQPPASILDVGCGNGRFARHAAQHFEDFDYLGVDQSEALLLEAQQQNPEFRFERETVDETTNREEHFDLVVAFGVFHHLPGFDYRLEVVKALGELLTEHGVLVASLWRPHELHNFKTKVASTKMAGLERGDYLLGWENDFSYLRYCHSFDDDEIGWLIGACDLTQLEHFKGSGNDITNDYVLLTR